MFSVAIQLGSPAAVTHYAPLPVSPALRGYAAEESQLRVTDVKVPVSITGLAARWCPTGRDLYLEKVRKLKVPTWPRSVLGKVVDELLVGLHRTGLAVVEDAFESDVAGRQTFDLDATRTTILEQGKALVGGLLDAWPEDDKSVKGLTLEAFAEQVDPGNGARLIEKTTEALFDLIKHETDILARYVAERRHVGGDWMAEVRATLTRLQTGLTLDGKGFRAVTFGLSESVRPDFVYAVTLIGDLKAGPYQAYYEGVATGYVIFAEYALHRRINTAAILAVDLDLSNGRVASHQVKIIKPDDELRTRWLTQRDDALSTCALPAEPPHPTDTSYCPECLYRRVCWQDGVVGGTPIADGAPVPPAPVLASPA